MTTKANPTIIGLFVLIGAGLGVCGLLLFSSRQMFTHTRECILYFDSSLNGLTEGAPVKYRGVRVGAVKHVMIHFNQAAGDYTMPVIIELRDDLLRKRVDASQPVAELADIAADVRRGLRGHLEADSFVTGVLYVGLDILTNAAPAERHHQLKAIYLEIPTEATHIAALMKNLAELDVKGMTKEFKALIARIDAALDALKAVDLPNSVSNLVAGLNTLARSPELTNTLVSASRAADRYAKLAEHLDRRIDPLVNGATNTLAQTDATLAELRATVQDLRALLGPDSALNSEARTALDQLGDAARSLAELAEFLRAHPNALITGRESPPKKP